MNRGYTLLWRKTWDNPVLHERGKRYSRLEAWLYLVNVKAQGIDSGDLKRGEFIASIRALSKIWNWGKSAVERFMNELERASEPMIMRVGQQTGHFAGHFIICKYDTYNPMRDTKRDTKRDTPIFNETENSIDIDNKTGTEIAKKIRIKEGEIKASSQAAGAAAVDQHPSVDAFRLSELLRQAIQVRDPKAKAAALPEKNLCRWARDIDKLIRLDGRRAEDIEAVIAWCQHNGNFWGPIILSGRKLRDKFDSLWGQMHRDGGKVSLCKDAMRKRQLELEKALNANQKNA